MDDKEGCAGCVLILFVWLVATAAGAGIIWLGATIVKAVWNG